MEGRAAGYSFESGPSKDIPANLLFFGTRVSEKKNVFKIIFVIKSKVGKITNFTRNPGICVTLQYTYY